MFLRRLAQIHKDLYPGHLLGCSPSTISRWRHGTRPDPMAVAFVSLLALLAPHVDLVALSVGKVEPTQDGALGWRDDYDE